MRVRSVLVLTAIVSSILGALTVYLVLSVPNDLRADALLKQARQEVSAGKTAEARQSLAKIVQQYPRTDAAAAATVALMSLADKDREDLARAMATLRRQNDRQSQLIEEVRNGLLEVKNAPPKVVTVQAPPAPKPAPPKKAPPKKKAPTKKRGR
jgi:thioredoxin-like negative regulator of GroEL